MSGAARRDDQAITTLLRRVRRRWRLRLALRGLAWTAGLTLGVAVLSALALEQARFDAGAVTWTRILTWGTLLASAAFFLVRPLLRRVTDHQVALYLEEHEPTLDHTVVSALHASGRTDLSPALSRKLSEIAVARARAVDDGRRVEQSALYRVGGALTAVAVAGLTLALAGPDHLRTGLSAVLLPTTDAAAVNPYSVTVEPGSVTIARGSDQMVTAALGGFEAPDASLFLRTGPEASFQRLSMLPADGGGFEVLLLGVDERTEYFVESTGVRSPTYAIDVADLPYVGSLDLTYHFPRYTGRAPRTVENGGDVAALPGTEVEVRIVPTLPSPAGRLLVDGEPVELTVEQGGTLVGRFTVREEGFYSVELARESGELVPASPEYAIDLLSDRKPTVRFSEPGRDTPASPIEEVYLEVAAEDDYGVGDVRLVYSVNGGAEDTIPVFRAGGSPLAEVSAGHTLFLEEFMLEPGDLVSYYALVRDNRDVGGGEPVVSDMFFLTIRPFERAYREGEQQGGGPPQGGGQAPETALSELQRQVISATFNLVRQRDSYGEAEFGENVVSVALTQGRLRDQVQNLVRRMLNRGLAETDEGFRDVSAILPRAAEAMDTARAYLEEEALSDAIPHEQSALRYLQQAEETYERYVTQQNQQGGGGGGGGQNAADDLADLFELEVDKLQNQYETVRRGEQQSADQQVDETLEKLKELARRQEQEMERQRRRAQAGQPGGGVSSENLRELADDAEEAARELARLARETNDQQLAQTARDLQEAADAMRQSAAERGTGGLARSEAARRRLDEARRRLESSQAQRARRDAEEALRQVDELARQQRDMQRQVRDLSPDPRASGRQEAVQRLQERKEQMHEAVQQLERGLDDAAAASRAEQAEAARELKAAADQIRESKLKEKIQYSRGTIQQWTPESASTLEMDIEADLQGLREQLERARDAAAGAGPDPLREALEDTRELVRGMESMDRRLRESADGARPGEAEGGREGEAPEGEEGRAGQPGEGAQPGQAPEGQRGQGGQAPEGGQPGEQGGAPGDPGARPGEARSQPGAMPPGGGATRGDPRRLSDEEARQYAREFGQRGGQARELRDRLRDAGRDTGELDAVLDAMNRLQREGIWNDPQQVAALNEAILEQLKRLEFGLRREVEGEGERRATLTGSDEVPPGYRELVEEYYRALARGARPGGG